MELVPQGLSQGLHPRKDRGPSLSRMRCFALMTRPYPQHPTCITEFPILEPRIYNFSTATMGRWGLGHALLQETELSIRASSTAQNFGPELHAINMHCPWSGQGMPTARRSEL